MVKVSSNEMEQLVLQCLDETCSIETKEVYITYLSSLLSNENVVQTVIPIINNQLQASTNRDKTMILLEGIICKVPQKVVVENAVFWLNTCINIHPNDVKGFKRFILLDKIIKTANQDHDFNKIFLGLLPKLIDVCVSIKNPKLTNSALDCLKTCLINYPGPCSVYKFKLENYLTQFLLISGNSNYTVKKAGSAFHFLQQIGGAGAEGINYIKNWTYQLDKFCSTVHLFLNEFFRDTMEFSEYEELPGPTFPITSDCNIDVMHCRLRNTVIFARCFLLEGYPVQKTISINSVLDVIKRGLVVDYKVEKTDENIQFVTSLLLLQVQLLELLHYFILCYQENLLPFSFTISKLLVDCLIRSQSNKYFMCNSNYQILVNKVLCCWINIAGNKIGNSFHEKILTSILNNISLTKDKVTLRLNADVVKQKSKAKQKAIREKIIASGNISYLTDPMVYSLLFPNSEHGWRNNLPNVRDNVRVTQKEFNSYRIMMRDILRMEACSSTYLSAPVSIEFNNELYATSLTTLNILLSKVILNLKSTSWILLYEAIIKQLLQIEEGISCSTYNNPKCKILLYESLVSLFIQPAPLIPPPVEEALKLLLAAQNIAENKSNGIASICVKGVALLEKLCQPVCSTLYFCGINPIDDRRKPVEDDRPLIPDVSENGSVHEEDEEDIAETPIGESNLVDEDDVTVIPDVEESDLVDEPAAKKIKILDIQIINPTPIDTPNNEAVVPDIAVESEQVPTEMITSVDKEITETKTVDTFSYIDAQPSTSFQNPSECVIIEEDNVEIENKVVAPDVFSEEDDLMLSSFVDSIRDD